MYSKLTNVLLKQESCELVRYILYFFFLVIIPDCKHVKCNTHRIDGMKGLDENIVKTEKVKYTAKCVELCNGRTDCNSFRYLPKLSF